MLLDKSQYKWYVRVLFVLIAVSAIAGAQTQVKRIPGRIIPPEYSGILLMESRAETEPPDTIRAGFGKLDRGISGNLAY